MVICFYSFFKFIIILKYFVLLLLTNCKSLWTTQVSKNDDLQIKFDLIFSVYASILDTVI